MVEFRCERAASSLQNLANQEEVLFLVAHQQDMQRGFGERGL